MFEVSTCKHCNGPLPPLAVAHDDPYCSRRCLELDLYGVSSLDPEKSRIGAMSSGLLKMRDDPEGLRFGRVRATLRSLGFKVRIRKALGVGDATCSVCQEVISGDLDELEWLAVEHLREYGCRTAAMDTKGQKLDLPKFVEV